MSHSNVLRMAGLAGVITTLGCATALPSRAPTPEPGAGHGLPAEVSLTGPLPASATAWIDRTLAGLTLRDRVAQMHMFWLLGDYTSTTDSTFAMAVERVELDKVGGVIMSLGTPIEVAAKVNALQARARIPLLVGSDVEPGLGRLEGGTFNPGLLRGGDATVLPSNMAIGATGSDAMAREAGRITGRESRAIGIHIGFAPSVDVNNNPANPVINVRSFGAEANAVSRLGAAFIEGMQAEGVAATMKHFPGHGDTDTDSHLAMPIVSASRARLDTLELKPFRAAVAAGVAAVMSAHVALPAVVGDSTPATLVASVLSGLLRDSLQFQGVTFTDAMDMRGIGAGYTTEVSSIAAVKAGVDVLLMPADIPASIAAVTAAVERGEISEERINASVRRLLELKVRTGAIQRPIVSLDSLREIVGSAAHRRAADRIAEHAITLLRDDDRQLPLSTGAGAPRTAIITFSGETDVQGGRVFANELRSLLPQSRVLRIGPGTPRARLDSLLRPGERVVLATFVRTIEGEGRFSVGEHVARWVDSIAMERRTTVVAFSNPYVIREFAWVGSYVATFGRGDAMERAAARALAGRIPFRGRSPIALPGFFDVGDGQGADRPADGRADASAAASATTPATTPALADTLQALLDRAVRDSVFPGAIAVIGNRAGIVTRITAGRIDWAADAPAPDLQTIWDVASLTKVLGMTTAMMQLVEQGRVKLDAPVQRYLPEWTGKDKDRVTVRHLLTHSSGLAPFIQLWKFTTDADSARRIVLNAPLDTAPGTKMVYSDLGAILLGMIVERVSGESLDQYVTRHIFTPLGMQDTRYRPGADVLARVAPTERDPWRGRHLRGEVHDENAFLLGGVSAHAGLFSTAADLSRFAQAMLGGGALGGVRIVRSETVRDFTRVQNALLSHRALGWETPNGSNSAGRVLRRPAFGHTGFTGTSIWIDPANDLFIILLSNRVNPSRENSRIGPVRTTLADLAATQAMQGRSAVRGTP